jgi:hypothetical protein
MKVYKHLKEVINTNKKKVELLQTSVISAIATLVYSQYVSRFRQRYTPTHKIFVPDVSLVQRFLDPEGEFGSMLSANLIDKIHNDPDMAAFSILPEFALLRKENLDITKVIFDLQILPNAARHIPAIMAKKFQFDTGEQKLLVQSNDIDLFTGEELIGEYFSYILHETVLWLIYNSHNLEIETVATETNMDIKLARNKGDMNVGHSFFTIHQPQVSISPIHFNDHVIGNPSISKLLGFVTSTAFTRYDADGESFNIVNTDVYNQVFISYISSIKETYEDPDRVVTETE